MNTTRRARVVVAAAITFAAIGGCHQNEVPAAYGGGPRLQANIDDGVARLASAKCDRAMRCGGIGPRKNYDSREQCETVMRGTISDDIRLKDCRGGIDEPNLQECMTKVRSESCGNPLEKLGSHTECRVSQICLD